MVEKGRENAWRTVQGVSGTWPSDRHHFHPHCVGQNSVISPGGIAEEAGKSITLSLGGRENEVEFIALSLPVYRLTCYSFSGIMKVPDVSQIFSYGKLIPGFSLNQG